MKPAEINAALNDIAARSSIEEFWITDSSGRAYLTNTGVDFTVNRDPAKQPQASAFWPLSAGTASVVTQPAQKREIDNRVSPSTSRLAAKTPASAPAPVT
jgi:methyl-accepting chemotaxis protein